jgi:hypothetical protein
MLRDFNIQQVFSAVMGLSCIREIPVSNVDRINENIDVDFPESSQSKDDIAS